MFIAESHQLQLGLKKVSVSYIHTHKIGPGSEKTKQIPARECGRRQEMFNALIPVIGRQVARIHNHLPSPHHLRDQNMVENMKEKNS